jgi:hypothetical protein
MGAINGTNAVLEKMCKCQNINDSDYSEVCLNTKKVLPASKGTIYGCQVSLDELL